VRVYNRVEMSSSPPGLKFEDVVAIPTSTSQFRARVAILTDLERWKASRPPGEAEEYHTRFLPHAEGDKNGGLLVFIPDSPLVLRPLHA